MSNVRRTTLAVTLAGALIASVALAYGPRTGQRPAFGGMQRGGSAELAGQTHQDLAAMLGMSADELTAARLSGKTVADLLVEHGLTTAEASAKLVEARDARIDAAVASGALDAQRAAVMKGRSQATVAALLTRELGPRAGMRWGPAADSPSGPAGRGGWGRQPGMRGGPGMGVHQPGTGFQPGYRFGPPAGN